MDEITKILVVDDERVVREGCTRVLEGKGYEVSTVENGNLAMEILRTNDIDIMLLDLKMPVMSGEEVLEWTGIHYPDIPIIIITGHGTIDTAVECMKKGAYDFITKPFQIDQFLITVNRAADKRRLEQKAKNFEAENIRNLYDLNLEKSRLKTIINCMANGVIVTNRNMEIVLSNPAIMRLFEISGEIEYPAPVDKVIGDESFINTLGKILSGEAAENNFFSQEIQLKDNCLRAISAPAKAPDDGIVGSVTVLEDITAFKKLDEMKSDFVNMVAHELRSPLVSIRQLNTVLLEGLAGPMEPKQNEFVERGVNKIDQLLNLINDLLDIARMESAQQVRHHVPLDIEKIIKDILALITPRADEKGISISCKCRDLKPIYADQKGMEELFNNLITNAINYSPDGGDVEIIANGLGEYIEIKVKDTGVGIDQEELPKIFDKFYRVKHPKTRQVMGTGLGLSLVKGIVDSHHGTIDVESETNKGTTFRILFPVISSDE